MTTSVSTRVELRFVLGSERRRLFLLVLASGAGAVIALTTPIGMVVEILLVSLLALYAGIASLWSP